MKFDDLDRRMRVFETAHDHCVLPGLFIIARLDGRGFTRLTKEVHNFDAPFDERFRDHMVATASHLMESGFNVIYGYTESDEISLLFHPTDDTFGRKTRKLNSVLAGEASAKFSLELGDIGVFDCRLSQIPTLELVVDYFRWRNEDAHRNALNAHCYWLLRRNGRSAREATKELLGLSTGQKNEFLFQRGINFNDIPNWQKRGIGFYWQEFEKPAVNGATGETVIAKRRRVCVDLNLPMREDYSRFINDIVTVSLSENGQ